MIFPSGTNSLFWFPAPHLSTTCTITTTVIRTPPSLQLPLSRQVCGDSRRSTLVVKTFVVTRPSLNRVKSARLAGVTLVAIQGSLPPSSGYRLSHTTNTTNVSACAINLSFFPAAILSGKPGDIRHWLVPTSFRAGDFPTTITTPRTSIPLLVFKRSTQYSRHCSAGQ